MELPRALAPWSALLALFPRDLALALGPLVQRLDPALAAPAPRVPRGADEPDGVEGIARRGLYERLLLSEWLLADEAPDEFIRRAAMGEHAFLLPARSDPARAGATVALFDTGPSQWGGPRLAHLAALIVLARRVSESRSRFVWGLLQTPDVTPGETVTPAGVRRLLGGRSVREASRADLRAWRSHLSDLSDLSEQIGGDADSTVDALWIVGGPRLAPLLQAESAALPPLSFLQVRDTGEPEVRRLEARLVRAGRDVGAPILLDLPPERIAARLVRDPFDAVSTAPATVDRRLAPASNLVFAWGGTKLLARAATPHILIAYPIPNSPRAPVGQPKQYRTGGTDPVVAASRVGKALVAVSVRAGSENAGPALRLEALSGKNRLLSPGEYPILYHGGTVAAAPDLLHTCLPAPDVAGDLLTLTGDGVLWRLHAENGTRTARVEALGVESAALVPVGVAVVCRLKERRLVMTRRRDGSQNLRDLDERGSRSFFGAGGHDEFGLLAFEGEPGRWSVLSKADDLLLTPPDACEVAGVAYLPHASAADTKSQPALVVIDSHRRSVSLLSRDGSFTLPRTSSPIRWAAASPFSWQVAYATDAGEVFVYSLADKTLLYRSVAGDAGDAETGKTAAEVH